MTKEEAMKLALEWIEAQPEPRMLGASKTITALREALDEPEQEPIRQYYYRMDECKAVAATDPDCICWHDEGTGPLKDNPEYVSLWRPDSPRREWVSLTDEEIDQAFSQATPTLRKIYQVIEAKLKEKNA